MIEVKLKDIALNITDGKHGDCQSEDNSGFYFISCKDIYDGHIHYSGARQITQKDYMETDKRTRLEPNDILVTNSGTIGRMSLVKDVPQTYRTTFQKSVAIVKPNKNIVKPEYLYYALANCVRQFINEANGAAQKNLLLGTMRDFRLKIEENLDLQDKISNILWMYDNLIENNQKQIKLLEEAAQRIYKEWFIDLHFPGYEATEIFEDIPNGWDKKKISDLGEIITGKTPSTTKKQYYGGYIPFVKIPDMHDCIYPIKTELSLTTEGANTQKNKFIPKNGIMVSCIATVGLVNIAVERCQTNQQINSIILNNEKDLYYVYSTMKKLKTLLEGIGSNGATMTNVNKTKFGNLEVLYPSEDLRKAYYDFCKPIFEEIYTLNVKISELSQARDCLLPKLMSGELEV